MIATCARPVVARAVRVGLANKLPVAVARPLTVGVHAYKDDAAKPDASKEQHQVAKQQDVPPAAVAPRAMHPAMRLPSLFHEMQREMDNMTRMFGMPSMFDDMFLSRPAPMLAKLELPAMPSMSVAVDVEEGDKAYVIKADTPGIPKDSLKLSVLDGTLTISGERREEKREGGEEGEGGAKTPLRFERSYGSFSRSFSLPPNVDVEAISAEAKDGVLTVTIPKVPEQKPTPKEIDIN